MAKHGKRYLEAREKIIKMKADFVGERERRRTNLERIAFGIVGDATPADLMAHRDAQDRAARIDSEEEAAAGQEQGAPGDHAHRAGDRDHVRGDAGPEQTGRDRVGHPVDARAELVEHPSPFLCAERGPASGPRA